MGTLVSIDGRGGAYEPFGSRGRGLAPAAGVHVGSFVGCAAGTRARCCFDVGWLLDGCGAPRADRRWCPGQHRHRGCRHFAGRRGASNRKHARHSGCSAHAGGCPHPRPEGERDMARYNAIDGSHSGAVQVADKIIDDVEDPSTDVTGKAGAMAYENLLDKVSDRDPNDVRGAWLRGSMPNYRAESAYITSGVMGNYEKELENAPTISKPGAAAMAAAKAAAEAAEEEKQEEGEEV